MRKLLGVIDRISWWTSHLAMVTIFVLIAAVCYEVVARYFFSAPTRWAFDTSYMLTGSIFILAVGLTTQENGHVRIDFLFSVMPARAQHLVNLVVTGGIVMPCMIWVTYDACRRALSAARTGEVEAVSPWAPLMWPFYTAIAVGLVVFCLQLLATTVRHAIGIARPDSVPAPSGELEAR